ncbi:MAG: hypothetical protein ACLRFL_01475 [Clostridia bacterium]
MIYDYFNNTPPDVSEDAPSQDEDNDDVNTDNEVDNDDNNSSNDTEDDNNTEPPPADDNIGDNIVDNNPNDENKDDSSDNENDDNSSDHEDIVYATDLVINYTGNLYLHVGQKVKIVDSFISVEPSEMREFLTYAITSRYNSDPSNVEFDGSDLIANKVGQYNLIYKVPNTETKDLEAKIVLIVDDEEDNTIEQKKNTLEVGSAPLSDYFDIKSIGDIRYECSENIEISNSTIIASKAGLANIDIIIVDNNIEIKYTFTVLVKDIPNYYIEISSSIAGEITDPSQEIIELSAGLGAYAFGFSVYDRNNQKVAQDVSIEIDNEEIASKIMITDGLVLLDCKKEGLVEIKITFNLDTSVYKIIHLEIK